MWLQEEGGWGEAEHKINGGEQLRNRETSVFGESSLWYWNQQQHGCKTGIQMLKSSQNNNLYDTAKKSEITDLIIN